MIRATEFVKGFKKSGNDLIVKARAEKDECEAERLRHEASIYYGLASAYTKRAKKQTSNYPAAA